MPLTQKSQLKNDSLKEKVHHIYSNPSEPHRAEPFWRVYALSC